MLLHHCHGQNLFPKHKLRPTISIAAFIGVIRTHQFHRVQPKQALRNPRHLLAFASPISNRVVGEKNRKGQMMTGQIMSSGNYYDWAPVKTSRVMAFHSKSRWEEHFEASKGTNKLMVIDFTATWCGPCRQMEPTIDELAATFADVDFIKIDVDELMNVSRQFGVQAMPTFLLMKNGKVVDKVVGAKKDELRNKIEQHSKKSQPYLRNNSYRYAYRYVI